MSQNFDIVPYQTNCVLLSLPTWAAIRWALGCVNLCCQESGITQPKVHLASHPLFTLSRLFSASSWTRSVSTLRCLLDRQSLAMCRGFSVDWMANSRRRISVCSKSFSPENIVVQFPLLSFFMCVCSSTSATGKLDGDCTQRSGMHFCFFPF